MQAPTIAIWGHYHGGNLGDELVVETIIDAIRHRLPEARIIGISMSPDDTLRRHGIDADPINPSVVARARRGSAVLARIRKVLLETPFIWRSYRLLRGVDLVVVAGSGQLLDEWNGPWLHPYTTFRWAMLARLARVPMVYPSVGAGPIESRLSAFFIRRALTAAAYISVRDGHSGRVLTSIGLPGPLDVCPDMGYGMSDELLAESPERATDRASTVVVGLNVMAHQDPRYWPRGDARRYEAFLQKMVDFTRWLLDNGYSVRLFSSQARSDGRVAADLTEAIGETYGPGSLESALGDIHDVSDLVREITACDVIVAGRYHSVLLPLLLDIPVLGLAYNPKTTELLTDAGHPEHSLDIDAFDVATLVQAFQDLHAEDSHKREERRRRVATHRAAVDEQFDRVLGAVRRADGQRVTAEVRAS